MKHIIKTQEPQEFTSWRNSGNENWQPAYEDLRDGVKQTLHQSLLGDQGYICCYCGNKIDENDENGSHIEHIRPQSLYPQHSLDYSNLLASCLRKTERKKPLHCGVKKGDWYNEQLFISPLQAYCESRFCFSGNGEIFPADSNDSAAIETISHLGLNIPKLTDQRKKVVETYFNDIETLTDAELNRWAAILERRNEGGRFEPFCFVLIQILREYQRANF